MPVSSLILSSGMGYFAVVSRGRVFPAFHHVSISCGVEGALSVAARWEVVSIEQVTTASKDNSILFFIFSSSSWNIIFDWQLFIIAESFW